MKYKSLMFAIATLAFCMSLVGVFAANSPNTPLCNPKINLVYQDPFPAVPDSYMKVVFEVSGLDNCNGYAIQLRPEYPFSLDPGVNAVRSIEKNPFAAGYKSAWNVPYTVRVASDALEGEYYIKIRQHQGTSEDFESAASEEEFNISIVDSQTDFAVVIQDASGSQASIGVVNIGKNTANSMIVSIPSQESFRATGTSQQIVGNLAAGDYTIASFAITPARMTARNNTRTPTPGQIPSADQDQQMLKIQIDYTDGIGQRRSVVKEIPYSNSFSGNVTLGNFIGRNRQNSSGFSWWWYVAIAIIAILIIWFIYRKYRAKKKRDGSSEHVPDWVSRERKTHKK